MNIRPPLIPPSGNFSTLYANNTNGLEGTFDSLTVSDSLTSPSINTTNTTILGTSSTFIQGQKIKPIDGSYPPNFGACSAVFGNYLLVGGPLDGTIAETNTNQIGSVWLFYKATTPENPNKYTWNYVTKFTPTDAIGSPVNFGGDLQGTYNTNLSIYPGNGLDIVTVGSLVTLAIGGSGDNNNTGAVWIYKNGQLSNNGFAKIAKIIPDTPTNPNPNFGSSVSLVYANNKYTLLIGLRSEDSGGAVWVYEDTGSGFTKTAVISPPDAIGNSMFGYSSSIVVTGTTYTAII
jgi:hypothetical protein